MNINKIGRELGWKPKHDLQEGLRKTVSWYLDHGDWVDGIRKQKDYLAWLDRNYVDRVEAQK
jgi:dTDP-glucose 4,6-dehydratase